MRAEDSRTLEDLIRLIVERSSAVGCHTESRHETGQSEEVMLDIQVDSVRYLVLRLPKPAQRAIQLSPREQEIVRLVALGHSNKIIADVLSISSWTVCTHLRRIFSKLGVGSRAAMVARYPASTLGQATAGVGASAFAGDDASVETAPLSRR